MKLGCLDETASSMAAAEDTCALRDGGGTRARLVGLCWNGLGDGRGPHRFVDFLIGVGEARRRFKEPRAGDGTYSSSVAFPSLSISVSRSESSTVMADS
jgi:hypothetical protein